MKYSEAIQSLKFKRDKKYVVIGNESYLKAQFLLAVRAFNPDKDVVEFWPDNVGEAIEALFSGGMFSDRFIILHYLDKFKGLEEVSRLIQSTESSVVAVFSDDANIKSRSLSSIVSKCSIVECVSSLKEYGEDYPQWISKKISDSGYTMEEGVPKIIYYKIGSDLSTITTELKKLFIYALDTKRITVSDVDSIISVTSNKSAFDILDRVMDRDVSGSLVCLDSYLKIKDGCIDIIAFLASYMEKMYRMILLRDNKYTIDSISEIVGIHKYLVGSRYLPKALEMGKSFIEKKIIQLSELDYSIRAYRGNRRVLMEKFIYGFSKS